MIRLETIEDFRRKAKILKDPESLPQQYVVKDWHENFGYCTICKTVTKCELYGDKSGGWVCCKQCNNTWTGWGSSEFYVELVSEMPATQDVVNKLTKLLPREKEKEKLAKLLEEFIALQKRNVTESKKQYRDAKKYVERGHKLLATLN